VVLVVPRTTTVAAVQLEQRVHNILAVMVAMKAAAVVAVATAAAVAVITAVAVAVRVVLAL
jgi:hypothetical protein